MVRKPRRGGATTAILFAVASSTSSVIPVGLTGVYVLQIRDDVGMALDVYGIVAAGFFVSTALFGLLVGTQVDRIGARVSLQIGTVFTGASLFTMALARSPGVFAGGLIVAGIGQAYAHPAANRLLSVRVEKGLLGLAFGLKQASIPSSIMIAGLSVPILGIPFGWRVTMMTFGTTVLMVTVLAQWALRMPSGSVRRSVMPSISERRLIRRPLYDLALGGTLGAAAASPLSLFLVDTGVDVGLSDAGAAGVLTAAGALGVVARVLFGWAADRFVRLDVNLLIALMMGGGVVGFLALAVSSLPLFLVGTLLAYLLGWSWNGLVHYVVVKGNPTGPGIATGVVQPGLAFGAGVGPLIFGLVAARWSFAAAWVLMAIMAFAGNLVLTRRALRLRRFARGGTRG